MEYRADTHQSVKLLKFHNEAFGQLSGSVGLFFCLSEDKESIPHNIIKLKIVVFLFFSYNVPIICAILINETSVRGKKKMKYVRLHCSKIIRKCGFLLFQLIQNWMINVVFNTNIIWWVHEWIILNLQLDTLSTFIFTLWISLFQSHKQWSEGES